MYTPSSNSQQLKELFKKEKTPTIVDTLTDIFVVEKKEKLANKNNNKFI